MRVETRSRSSNVNGDVWQIGPSPIYLSFVLKITQTRKRQTMAESLGPGVYVVRECPTVGFAYLGDILGFDEPGDMFCVCTTTNIMFEP